MPVTACAGGRRGGRAAAAPKPGGTAEARPASAWLRLGLRGATPPPGSPSPPRSAPPCPLLAARPPLYSSGAEGHRASRPRPSLPSPGLLPPPPPPPFPACLRGPHQVALSTPAHPLPSWAPSCSLTSPLSPRNLNSTSGPSPQIPTTLCPFLWESYTHSLLPYPLEDSLGPSQSSLPEDPHPQGPPIAPSPAPPAAPHNRVAASAPLSRLSAPLAVGQPLLPPQPPHHPQITLYSHPAP